jgi:hypothetical protein
MRTEASGGREEREAARDGAGRRPCWCCTSVIVICRASGLGRIRRAGIRRLRGDACASSTGPDMVDRLAARPCQLGGGVPRGMIAWPGHGGRCGPGPRPFLSGQRCSAPFRRGRCQIALGREWPTAREGRPRQGRRTITDRPTVRRAFSVLCPPLPFGGARGRAALEICHGSRRPTTLRTCPSEFSFAARVQFPAPQSIEAHAQSKRVCRYLRRRLFAAGSPREKNTFRAYKQVTTSSTRPRFSAAALGVSTGKGDHRRLPLAHGHATGPRSLGATRSAGNASSTHLLNTDECRARPV